ncbi:MAG: hypothetical protein E3J72_12000 [Planctomycetota bacterium]|nr:MAG: hypothetical protein E3J72_12000 [Planctomycetota bacterium]
MALKRLKWLKYLFVNRVEAETEQQYWNDKRKKHLAGEHSEGVVAGLDVAETVPPSLSVDMAAGRSLDTEGNDPEVESPQELDCAGLVPPTGEVTVYVTLRYNTTETEPYFVDEIGDYQNKYTQDSYILEATTQPPVAPQAELARFRLGAGATEIRDAADPNNPGLNEIDLRSVKYSGKEVLALRDLSDVDPDEADAFNNMNSPSASNPVATAADVEDAVAPVRDEVEAARGSEASLDGRLDVMLNEDGSFKGITQITPAAPLTGGGTAGDVPIGIADATPAERGAMSSADKTKLDGIEPGATADQTAQEILDALKTVDGAGSGLDADLLDGSQHKGLGGSEHAIATPFSAGFMGSSDRFKLDNIEFGATADQTPSEILTAIKTVDGPGSGLDADTVDGKHYNELTVDPATIDHNSLAGLFGGWQYNHLSSKQNNILNSGYWKWYQAGEDSPIQFAGSFRLAFIKNNFLFFGTRTFRIHLERDGGEMGNLSELGTILADWDLDYIPNPAWIRDFYVSFAGIWDAGNPSWWAFKINWLQLVPSDEVSTLNLTGLPGDDIRQLSTRHWDLLVNFTFRGPSGGGWWGAGPDWATANVYFTYYKLPLI